MIISKYSFIRSELRVLQNMCEGDNEEFLNQLADMIGNRDEQIKQLKQQAADDSWITNPDRMGGVGWSAEELDPNGGWK